MLKNKCALITGSTSGIGLGIAKSFASQGCHLVINGFGKAEDIAELQKMLQQEYSVQVHYSAADMSKPAEIRQMIQEAEEKFGAVDILVNNAGIQFVSSVEEFPEEKWNAIIAINLTSNFHAIKAVLPKMKERKWGRIINIASVHGLVASPFKSAYVAAKHGVLGLTKTIALELANENITCNAICPGYVLTPLVEGQIDDQAKVHNLPREKVISEVILASQPKKEFVQVEQLGALALFLASDAANAMTGACLPMDGAWTAR
ncbi:MAG TPA: 3-hydroxybutyrate dehydrogenase, partial [Bdellovibrio sp.]|nr:3-hydroxybutyrate dehydrogenase [Bdellovibrio sp.]